MKPSVGIVLSCAVSLSLFAAERKPLASVEADAFIKDTQVTMVGAGDDHVALAWWIPQEFWASTLARDPSISEKDKKEMLDTLEGVSLLSVVQADISAFGSFDFYSKAEIEEQMKLAVVTREEKSLRIAPLDEISGDLEILLGVLKPILGAAMGSMGNNMHFYVLDDTTESPARLLDPYLEGKLDIELRRRDGARLHANIETPLNSLFVPRRCPNGKEAHISWNYCPWSGKKLD